MSCLRSSLRCLLDGKRIDGDTSLLTRSVPPVDTAIVASAHEASTKLAAYTHQRLELHRKPLSLEAAKDGNAKQQPLSKKNIYFSTCLVEVLLYLP